MVIPNLSTSNPEDTFSFELEVTHSYVNRTVIQSKQIDLTFVNVPQAPSIPDVKTPFTLSVSKAIAMNIFIHSPFTSMGKLLSMLFIIGLQ